jgi:hypothetical protein
MAETEGRVDWSKCRDVGDYVLAAYWALDDAIRHEDKTAALSAVESLTRAADALGYKLVKKEGE